MTSFFNNHFKDSLNTSKTEQLHVYTALFVSVNKITSLFTVITSYTEMYQSPKIYLVNKTSFGQAEAKP